MSTNEKTKVTAEETKESKAENKKEELKKDTKAEETKAEATETATMDDMDGDDEKDEDLENLFKHRVSLDLTPENASFFQSTGGLLSLKVIQPDGTEETFERVIIRRSFPITAPDEFLSVREPDSRQNGRGSEIGMIRYISTFDKATVELISAELNARYFTPILTKIYSIKLHSSWLYFEAETEAGPISFVLNNTENIRILEDGRVLIYDIDGNIFLIPDLSKLDRQSYKCLDIYIP